MAYALKALSRKLRSNPTEAESLLWNRLRRKQLAGLKFRRQVPIARYIVDFLCFEKRLIIELDGGQHVENNKDIERTHVLESNGFHVLRFWNNEVFENMDGVLQTILITINPHLHPPPQGEEINRAHLPLPEGGDRGEGL